LKKMAHQIGLEPITY